MARKEKGKGVAERLDSALAGGDHGSARAEARRVLGDAAAPEADREAATRVLRSLAPEPAAAVLGAIGAAAALVVAAWLLTRG
jgi:hypothetical protein